MELRPFDPVHAPTVASWARTDDEARAWCARDRAPVPPEAVLSWSREDGVAAYLLHDEDGPVAYGELWVDDDDREVELARLIVDPKRRSRGVGRRLAVSLAEAARRSHPRVFLRVRPENAAALRCYSAAGFRRVSAATEEAWNRGQPAVYVWMERGLSSTSEASGRSDA
jgi:ribosomal protein S18 acetylase RimI-like enzyme